LNQILSRESREDLVDACHEYLRSVAEDVSIPGRVPIEKYVINKGLTKDPKDYADAKNQPHVQVALRMNAAGKSVKALDTVPYVVCVDGTNNPASQRAYHPDDLRKNDELKIDTEYYLKNQLHPVVARLMDPIAGTDSAQIADCLGLNAQEFLRATTTFNSADAIGMGMMSQMSDTERFKGAEKLNIRCQKCGVTSEFPGVFRTAGAGDIRCGLLCDSANCTASFSVPVLCNTLSVAMRQHISKYYRSELKCDDETCHMHGTVTRQLSVRGTSCLDEYCRGNLRPIYSDAQLYSQLSYYLNLFDTENALKKLDEDVKALGESVLGGHAEAFGKVYTHVDKQMQHSARKHVDLGGLFSRLGLGLKMKA